MLSRQPIHEKPPNRSYAYLVKGQYKTITGIVLKVDQTEQRITIRSGADTEVISFADIYRISKPT